MKFRNVNVIPKTINAHSPEELDEKISQFEDIFDLQFSTHTEYVDEKISSSYSQLVEKPVYCALILIKVPLGGDAALTDDKDIIAKINRKTFS